MSIAVIASADPELVIGDRVRLRAALENLIDNAVKFTERGRVALSVGAAAVRRGFVTISIELFARFRALLESELRDRTLVLAAPLGTARHRAHAALLEALRR